MNRLGLFLFMVTVAVVAVWMPEIAWANANNATDPCAQFLFCVPETDISARWLEAAFPELVDVGSTPNAPLTGPATVFGNAIKILNSAALAVGSLLLTYKLFAGIVQTANDGEVLGKRWSTLWGPVRVAAAAALIVPTASGYCLAQVAVMGITLTGVGLANKVWSATVDGLLSTQGMVAPQVHVNHERIARQVFANNVCLHMANYVFLHEAKDNNDLQINSNAKSVAGKGYPWAWAGANIYTSTPKFLTGVTYNNAGVANPTYRDGEIKGAPNIGNTFDNGPLFYRRASWAESVSGNWRQTAIAATEAPGAFELGWTAVPRAAMGNPDPGFWARLFGWASSLFGWSFADNSCGSIVFNGLNVSNTTQANRVGGNAANAAGNQLTGLLSTLDWRNEDNPSANTDAEIAASQLATDRAAIANQANDVFGEPLLQLAKDLDAPAMAVAGSIVADYIANPRPAAQGGIAPTAPSAQDMKAHADTLVTATARYGIAVRNQMETYVSKLYPTNDGVIDRYRQLAKDGGWVVAGEWYLQLMKVNASIQRLMQLTPRVDRGLNLAEI
ncbi:MAG: DotA/TraY family protein, partial [Pseudomonadota bacterium]